MFSVQKIKTFHFKSLSKKFIIKGVATFLVALLPFLIPFFASADCGNYYPSEDVAKFDLEDSDVSYYWDLYLDTCRKWSSEDNSFIVLRSDVDKDGYNQVYYFLIKWRGNLSFQDSDFKYSSSSSNNISFYISDLNKDKFKIKKYSNFYNGDSANFGCTFYNCALSTVNINNVDIIYCNIRENDSLSGYPKELPTKNYDKNNLNEYPVNTINITSPEEKSNIKTNDGYFNVVIKGKIGINFSESLLGNALFPMTPEMIGKYIRRDFRYSVDGDIEDENNLTYLGVGNKGFSNYLIEYLNQFYQDISVDIDKNKVGNINTNWTIGVTGNMNEWSKKHYYNFIINTRLWCGYLNNNLNYKFSFTVPTAFSGGLTDVNPSEYKTIVIDNYSLSRGVYVDDDFDGIDDTSLEVIPDSEIEIIHPGFVYPSTSTPVDNNFNDGDVVQNNNNNINVNNGSEISAEEKNGILNMLDNGVRKTTTLLSNLKNSMSNLGNTLKGLFDLLPEPVGYLFYSALCLSLIFFILSLRR